MIEKIAERIADKLIGYEYIDCNKREDYVYAMIMSMESWISIFSIVLIGMLFHVLVPTIFFLIFFLAIKRRSNGYHAETFQSCYLFSISVFLFFVAVLSPAMQHGLYVTYVLFILSAIMILTIGAVNHPNIHWSGEELRASKKAARWVVLMESGVFSVLSYLGADEKIIVFMAFAVILSSVLLLLAKISKLEERNYGEESGGKESYESHQQGSWQ